MPTLKHLGIILDGNRRWARAQNKPTFFGHQRGFSNLKKIASHAYSRDINILTVYAFSTENWNRSQEELSYLFKLFKILVTKEVDALHKKGVKLNIFGNISAFDKELQRGINQAIAKTKNNKKGTLNVCLNYGGREEIIMAVKKIIKNKVKPDKINQKLISKYLYSKDLPDPDMIIRTSGEQRLSGFLTWQGVYSELYFSKKHWPEFTNQDLDLAIKDFNKRQRRFGGN
ncbi:di-trans,poly-cis-decaprenylcistransferase [Candidatus Parcubacteria bacterium]|nr:MAG: di-trans,poly-cis-decaprenylcistransferase [Candidatus Parcubacteria bacterium]